MITNLEKRALLRGLYRSLAEINDIPWPSDHLPCRTDCDGTCPACQAELLYLETELNRRAADGTQILLAGITVAQPTRRGDMSLEELGLSLRTRVSLDGHGITGVRQLLDMSPSELKKVRNMTQEGLDEIEYQLGLLGLELENDL